MLRSESGGELGAIDVFVTPNSVGASSEVTDYSKGLIAISTGAGASADNLAHGLIHALGIAGGVNGYSSAGYQDTDSTLAKIGKGILNSIDPNGAESNTTTMLNYMKHPPPANDNYHGHPVANGMPVSSTALYPNVSREIGVLREGARRYLKK